MRILRHLHAHQGDIQTGAAIVKNISMFQTADTQVETKRATYLKDGMQVSFMRMLENTEKPPSSEEKDGLRISNDLAEKSVTLNIHRIAKTC